MKLVNKRELKRQYELEPRRCVQQLQESLESKKLRPEHFSVRDLFESLVENGRELLEQMSYRKSGGLGMRDVSLLEFAGAVDTSAFSSITGQIIYNRIKEAYDDPAFIWQDLCTTVQTQFLDGERIPEIGRIGDKAEIVEEGAIYPNVGLNEAFIDTAPTKKRGFIVPVTREIVIADRTGVLLKYAGEGGFWLGRNKEKRVLDVVTGITNNYKRNNTATNTYLTAGAYINDQTGNALSGAGNEWRALELAELLFDAITDPNTGEPIAVVPDTLIVPSALKRTANRIVGATEVVTVDNRANAATTRTVSPNPYAGSGIKVVSSPYIKSRNGSATKWFFGKPKEAINYMEVWDVETLQAASNSEAEFIQDILMRFKCSERGVAQVVEPRVMTRNDT